MNKKHLLIFVAVFGGLLVVAFQAYWNQKMRISEKTPLLSVDDASIVSAGESKEVALGDGEVYDLVITPIKKKIDGQELQMLGYNGSIPGPTLRVPEGGSITVRLKNGGDIATTLHAHGVRMDNAFDGVPEVTQREIAPGESFVYQLKFPDPGIFWYHPHVRTDYALESGLYGNIIVTPKDGSHWGKVNREIPVMLDDIALDQNGRQSFDAKGVDHTLMGRFGNVMLVNGESGYTFSAKQGEVVRLYLTNAANTRLFNFTLPGVKMKLIGADVGRYTQEVFVDEVLLAPGERRVVDVFFETSGTYTLLHQTPGIAAALGTVVVDPERVAPSYADDFMILRTDETVTAEMRELFATYQGKVPDKELRLSLDMSPDMQSMMENQSGHMGGGHMMHDGSMMSGADMGMGDDEELFEWEDTMPMMNRASTADTIKWKLVDTKTGKENMKINDWVFARGDKVKIRIFNDPKSMHPMQHPIHFHGQRFLVLSTNGVANTNPVWVDTALIAKGDTVDLVLEASNPGTWMVHCHILEHAESGMMLTFKVD